MDLRETPEGLRAADRRGRDHRRLSQPGGI